MGVIKEIELALADIFKNMGLYKPSNFDDILEYVANYIGEMPHAKHWCSHDVAIAFKSWIEAQSNVHGQQCTEGLHIPTGMLDEKNEMIFQDDFINDEELQGES